VCRGVVVVTSVSRQDDGGHWEGAFGDCVMVFLGSGAELEHEFEDATLIGVSNTCLSIYPPIDRPSRGTESLSC
jgi:hypothetical protein